MDAYPLIVFRDSPVGSRPMLEGSRLDVSHVIDTVRNEGVAVDAAADYLGLSATQIRACLRYYSDHQEEVTRCLPVSERSERSLLRGWER